MTCRIFICILLEWHSCNKEKKIMASSLIEIKVKNDKTKTMVLKLYLTLNYNCSNKKNVSVSAGSL